MPASTNLGMGYVFEELIRKFNEENNEEAGEHFTPREVIELMTHLVFDPVKDRLPGHDHLRPGLRQWGHAHRIPEFHCNKRGQIRATGDVYSTAKRSTTRPTPSANPI
jgi:type I restriction enzyme M protein